MPTTSNGGRGRPPIDRGEFFYDDDTKAFFATLARSDRWNIFPYGRWLERDGSKVIFDRKYRPICCVPVDGAVEIVPSDVQVHYVDERFLHTLHPHNCAEARAATLEIVERYGLEAELRRRRALGRDLPRWSYRPAQPTVGERL